MFAAMAFLFIVNIIVVSMVVREVCGTITKEIAIREPSRQEEEEALTSGQQVERREQSGESSEPFYALRAATLGRGHEMFHNDMIREVCQ